MREKAFADPSMLYGPFMEWRWDGPATSITLKDVEDTGRELAELGFNPGWINTPRFHEQARMVNGPKAALPNRSRQLLQEGAATARAGESYLALSFPELTAQRFYEQHPELRPLSISWECRDVPAGESLALPPSWCVMAARYSQPPESLQRAPFSRVPPLTAATSQTLPATPDVLPHLAGSIQESSLQWLGGGDPFSWTAPGEGVWRVYVFHRYYPDAGPFNLLHRQWPGAFFQMVVEPVLEIFPTQAGRALTALFQETPPAYGHKMAWSQDLERRFFKKYGRHLRFALPLLVDQDEEGKWARARCCYFEAVGELYAANLKTLSQALESRGMALGALFPKQKLGDLGNPDIVQTLAVCALPGGQGALFPEGLEPARTVAEVEGRRLAWAFSGDGQKEAFSPTAIKQTANALLAGGANLLVPRSAFVTESDSTERDWLAPRPYKPFLTEWTSFVRRACYIGSQGEAAPQVLTLLPQESLWALTPSAFFHPTGQALGENFAGESRKIEDALTRADVALARNRVDFLRVNARTLDRMAVRDGALIYENRFRCRAVVLPPLSILPRSTLRQLLAFAATGGLVISLGELPGGSTEQGMGDPLAIHMARILGEQDGFIQVAPEQLEQVIADFPAYFSPRLFFEGPPFPMLQQHRRMGERHFFWLANNSGKAQTGQFKTPMLVESVRKWDCETGEVTALALKRPENGRGFTLDFGPYEGFWLELGPEKDPYEQLAHRRQERRQKQKPILRKLDQGWRLSWSPDQQPPLKNAICPQPLANGQVVKTTLGDWTSKKGLQNFAGLLDYEQELALEGPLDGEIWLDLGRVEVAAELWVNGRRVGARLWPPYRFELSDHLRFGTNVLKVRVANQRDLSSGGGLYGPVQLIQQPR